jgi:sugar lactone lactonase YvrE
VRGALATLGITLALLSAYFLLWPVPVDPVSWQAPLDRGYEDPYAENELLKSISGIDLGVFEGPEDATLGPDNLIYATSSSGAIVRIKNRGVSEVINVGGRPLGIETDHDGALLVANAHAGIQRIGLDGVLTTVLDEIDGQPLANANNLGIGPDGVIYFSQSSTKFKAADFGGSYQASLLDILEHGGHGNVYAYDPIAGRVDQLITGLNYANGVAVSKDGSFILVAETSSYRIIKYWLTGDLQGTSDILMDNLPGFPDNIKNGLNGRFWIGFAAPRNKLLDEMSERPFIRKIIQRLPTFLQPKAVPFSHVIAINGDGEVLMNLHDPTGRYPTLTGVLETRDSLYLTTLFGNHLPRLKKRDLLQK